MNPEERVSRPGEPGSRAVGMSHGSSARAASGRTSTEQAADVEAAREAPAGIGAGAATVPADQVRAELAPGLAIGSGREPGVL